MVGFEDIDSHQSGSVSFVVKTEDCGGIETLNDFVL